MDFYEFIEKSGDSISKEDYRIAEYVYLNGPSSIIGGHVTAFCEWYNKNGRMNGVRALYPFVKQKKDQDELINSLCADIEELHETIESLEKKIRIYDAFVSEDDLLAHLKSVATKDDLLKFIGEYWE